MRVLDYFHRAGFWKIVIAEGVVQERQGSLSPELFQIHDKETCCNFSWNCFRQSGPSVACLVDAFGCAIRPSTLPCSPEALRLSATLPDPDVSSEVPEGIETPYSIAREIPDRPYPNEVWWPVLLRSISRTVFCNPRSENGPKLYCWLPGWDSQCRWGWRFILFPRFCCLDSVVLLREKEDIDISK